MAFPLLVRRSVEGFTLLSLWLWLNLYTGEASPGYLYFIMTAPPMLFLIVRSPCIFNKSVAWASNWFILFGVLSVIVSIIRGDYYFAQHWGIVTLFILIALRLRFDVRLATLICKLFFLSIILSPIMYYAGLNEWGFIPGQSILTLDQGGWFRVSLFPWNHIVASSQFALFSFLCFLYFFPSGIWKLAGLVLSVYFVLLSGVRLSQFGLLLVIFFWFYGHIKNKFSVVFLKFAPVSLVFAVVVFTTTPVILANVLNALGLEMLSSFVLHVGGGSGGEVSEDTVTQSAFRGLLWAKHLELFVSNPLFGVGQFDLWDHLSASDDVLTSNQELNHSESMLTYSFAQFGLIFGFFILGLVAVFWRHAGGKNYFGYSAMLVLLLGLMFHGSYFYPFHLIFFLWLFAFNLPRATPPPPLFTLSGDRKSTTARSY